MFLDPAPFPGHSILGEVEPAVASRGMRQFTDASLIGPFHSEGAVRTSFDSRCSFAVCPIATPHGRVDVVWT